MESYSSPNDLPNALLDQVALKTRSLTLVGVLVFMTGILYYCFAYLLRVYPNIMESNLLAHFHITANGFGMITGFYYFAYAPMQIPVGVSVDKIGPRRSLIFACLISTLGAFIFSSTSHLGIALLGRFLIGFGAAFGYVTALKLATVWLPKEYFATATGAVTGLGMIAAIFTEIGFTHILENVGYTAALRTPLYIGLALLAIILLAIKDKPKKAINHDFAETAAVSFKQLGTFLKEIIKHPQMWLIGIVGCLLYLPSSVFLDAWAIPYLRAVDHFSATAAADGAAVMLAGWIVSSFIVGFLSDLLGTRKVPLILATGSAAIIAAVLLYSHHLAPMMIYLLLFIFGLCCGPHPLCFALSKEHCDKKISGTAVSFTNFVIMMGGFLLQPLVGKLLDLNWSGAMYHGIRQYSAHNYTVSLSIIPIALLLAFMLTLFLKETHQGKNTAVDVTTHEA